MKTEIKLEPINKKRYAVMERLKKVAQRYEITSYTLGLKVLPVLRALKVVCFRKTRTHTHTHTHMNG